MNAEENIISEFKISNLSGFRLSDGDITTGKIIINNIEITTIDDWNKVIKSLNKLQQENKQLKEQLQQREDIINKAKEFIEKHNETIGKLYFKCSNMYLLSEIKEDLLKILDNKGEYLV